MIYDRPFEHHPFALFVASLVLQWLAAYLGHFLRIRRESPRGAERADLVSILGATMTLLALLLGFTFAMAIGHYDERKHLEDAEATAISSAYLRADLLPAEAAAQVRDLLSRYIQQRILFYQANDPGRLRRIRSETERLEAELWSAVVGSATAAPTAVIALAVSGMSDVLNSEAHADAAWRRHVPVAAWYLMGLIAFSANLLLGASAKRKGPGILVVLPLVMSIPVFLIASIDSPRAGFIRVTPVDLVAHAQSLRPKS